LSNIISLRKCENYDSETVRKKLKDLFKDLGGAELFFKKGKKVLLKPNFLKDDPKNKGIITHPEIIKAVAEIALDAGCKVMIGDSPGWGKVDWILEKSGFKDFFKGLPVELTEFSDPVEIKGREGGLFKRFYVSKQINEADIIINLPKLKTHGQMLVSLAVKNMFGAVVGKSKAQWHLNAGKRYMDFAKMLVDLHYLVKPQLNIIDGIIGMENEGPAAGDPVELGFIGASPDAVALDRAVCRILNIDEEKVFTLVAAKELGLGIEDSEVMHKGDIPSDHRIESFKLPRIVSLETLGIFPKLGKFLKNALTVRPNIIHEKCIKCQVCIKQCPANVMTLEEGSRDKWIKIAYRDCIRCFCCQEICPEEAIKLKRGWLLKVFDKFKDG